MAVRRMLAITPGLVVAAGGTAAVAGLADSVRESNGLAAYDVDFTSDVVRLRSVQLTDVARTLTFLGDVPVLVLLTLIAAVVLWRTTKSLRPPVLLLVAMAGSAALTYGIKLLVERQRPGVSYVLGSVDTTYSFPSGHTLNSAVFLLTLTGLLWMSRAGLGWRIAGTAIAVLLSVGIGASRIYLGYHWATDVLGGWLLAATWLSVVATGAYLTRRPGG
ncbi:MAG TPA: phosphatase PAP2 family protein [Kribbella sp.]|nr:phosphatase PAP2 family protein [Kribbella sp.]